MATLNTNAENVYKKGFNVLLQQTASKFRPLVTVENFNNAEEFYINQIGATTVAAVADLSAASTFTSTTTARRQITKNNYVKNELVLDDQLNDMSFDPKSAIVQNTIRRISSNYISKLYLNDGSGNFQETVYAIPSSSYFQDGVLADLLKEKNRAELVKLMNLHIVKGEFEAKDLVDGMELETISGEKLKVTFDFDEPLLNGVKFTSKDLFVENGVIHTMGQVLMPTIDVAN